MVLLLSPHPGVPAWTSGRLVPSLSFPFPVLADLDILRIVHPDSTVTALCAIFPSNRSVLLFVNKWSGPKRKARRRRRRRRSGWSARRDGSPAHDGAQLLTAFPARPPAQPCRDRQPPRRGAAPPPKPPVCRRVGDRGGSPGPGRSAAGGARGAPPPRRRRRRGGARLSARPRGSRPRLSARLGRPGSRSRQPSALTSSAVRVRIHARAASRWPRTISQKAARSAACSGDSSAGDGGAPPEL